MLQEHTFNTKQVSINYAEGSPAGTPLVLLHGGGDRWQHFLPILPSLVLRWHVYALDLRGHGKSGRVPGKYRPEHYVADIKAFFERKIEESAILLGHSLGGWVALMAAVELREKVRALILGDPPLNIERFLAVEGSDERIKMWVAIRNLVASNLSVPELAAALADLFGGDAAHFHGLAMSFSQADPDAIQYHTEGRLTEYVAKLDLDTALRQITCPVLLLQADPSHGGIVSDSDVDHALSLLPDGQYAQLNGASHELGLDTWEVAPLLQAVTDFLEMLSAD
jgi:pimeloyl-ACP methyl ester carboxylesterase